MAETWYVCVTRPKMERLAQEQFKRSGIETFLPLQELPPTLDKPLSVAPLWPSYIFVAASYIPEEAYAASHLIRTLEKQPIAVPHGVVEHWRSQADADGLIFRYTPPPEQRYLKDDIVRVICGPYIGSIIKVVNHYGDRIKTKMACLGGERVVSLSVEQVAPIEFGAIEPSGAASRLAV
jgi:transcription antitermination factor NusG